MIPRKMWAVGVTVGVVIIGALGAVSAAAVTRQPDNDWTLSDTQLAQARQALMLISTQTDPDRQQVRVTGDWPSNITAGLAFGTDRAAADKAMGEPQESASSTQRVVCAEAKGQFSNANLPHPPNTPAKTYSYAVVCFDPTSGDILDTGYDDKALDSTFSSTKQLNIVDAITSTVDH